MSISDICLDKDMGTGYQHQKKNVPQSLKMQLSFIIFDYRANLAGDKCYWLVITEGSRGEDSKNPWEGELQRPEVS